VVGKRVSASTGRSSKPEEKVTRPGVGDEKAVASRRWGGRKSTPVVLRTMEHRKELTTTRRQRKRSLNCARCPGTQAYGGGGKKKTPANLPISPPPMEGGKEKGEAARRLGNPFHLANALLAQLPTKEKETSRPFERAAE